MQKNGCMPVQYVLSLRDCLIVFLLCLSQAGIVSDWLNNKHRIMQTMPHHSPGTLAFWILVKIKRGHPKGGVKFRWSRLK